MKVCPNCGHNSESKFCPDCGTLMETVMGAELDAVADTEVMTDKAENADVVEVENGFTDSNEEIVKESLESDENANSNAPELNDTTVKKKKNVKKIIKIVAIAILAVFIAFIALGCIVSLTTPDLGEEESMEDYYINGIEYEIPASWETDEEESSELYHRYMKEEDGEVIAIADVQYTGENDLDSGDAAYTDEHPMPDDVEEKLPGCAGTYQEIVAGTSVFEVTVYVVEGEVTGESSFLSMVAESFDVENYDNGRESLGVVAEYTGSTKAGVTIDSESEDVTVTETFETALGEGVRNLEWTIDNPVTLKAGQTSTVVIKAEGITKKLKVECSTLSESQYKAKCKSRNYKDQLRESSYGEYIKIYGQVLQDCGYGYYRISSSGGYDDVYMVYAPDSDIVEDDWATVYGVTDGIYTYETVMGAEKKIPSIEAKYVYR